MARSSIVRKANISTGAISVSTSPDGVGNLTENQFAQNTNFDIPINSMRVWIKNLGGSNNSTHSHIMINGTRVEPGESAFTRTAYRDTTVSPAILKRLPAYSIITNGAWVEAVAEYL